MQAPFHDKYSKSDSNFGFPTRDVPNEEKKTEAYAKNIAESMYALYNRNNSSISYDDAYRYSMLRLMARGKQPREWYMPKGEGGVLPNQDIRNITGYNADLLDDTSQRKGYGNIDWDIISPAPKIIRMLLGLLTNIKKDVVIDNIDSDSGAEQEQSMYKTWVEAKYYAEIAKIVSQAGLQLDEPELIPDTMDELQMMRDTGQFKLQFARIMEKLIKHTEIISKYDGIHEDLIRDVIEIGVIGAREYYCEKENKVKYKYLDPERCIYQWDENNDFENIEYAGEISYDWTVSRLLQTGLFTRDELQGLAKQYRGVLGNPMLKEEEWNSYIEKTDEGNFMYDNFKIAVLDYEWIEFEGYSRTKFTDKYNHNRNIPYKKGHEKNSNNTVVNTKLRKLYGGKWLIGTSRCFDYGPVKNQGHPPKLSFKFYKFKEASIVEQICPMLHNIQMHWLKHQNALAMVLDKGYAVDLKMLNNIQMGGKKMHPLDVIRLYKQTGILFHMSTMPGQFYKGGATIPVQEIQGGLGTRLTETFEAIRFNMNMINEITGLPPVALGSSNDDPVKSTQLSMNAAHNSLKYLLEGVFDLRRQLADKASYHIQLLVRNVDKSYKAYADVVGVNDIEILKLAEKQGRKYGASLATRPSDEEKAKIYEWIMEAMTPGRDGVRDISIDTAIVLKRMLDDGNNIKEVEFKLKSEVRKNKREQRMQAERNIAIQTQQQAQLEQQKAQSKMQQSQMEAQKEIAVEDKKSQNNMRERTHEANLEYIDYLKRQVDIENLAESGKDMERYDAANRVVET